MNNVPRLKSTSHLAPRKVIVGTAHQGFRPPYPGLDTRLEELSGLIDRMASASQARYGRGVDLVLLPEMAVTGGKGGWNGTPLERSLPFEGAVQDFFAKKARQHRSYIVAPMNLIESASCSNVAILVDRKGEPAGVYRKVHLAVKKDSDDLEGGVTPGREIPVFDCDFGRIGVQICMDVIFDYGWQQLARKGAEIVLWPTFRPGTAHGMARAMAHRYFIVSSTHGDTAHVFEPVGKIVAQAAAGDPVLVQEIDLSYAIIVPWNSRPGENGAGFKAFGDRVGYRCYAEEGMGVYWSNDPKMSIGEMVRSVGACELESEVARTEGLYRKAGVVGY